MTAMLCGVLWSGCGSQKQVVDGATGASQRTECDDNTYDSVKPLEQDGPTSVIHQIPENRIHLIGGNPVNAIPKGVAFKMSGAYENNVPLNLNADGTLASYPAPTDITTGSAPIRLADGWWLDRRGVSANTVFSRYTLGEYSSLPEAPSPAQLLESIIPGARVTQVERLPMSPAVAAADTAAVNAYLRSSEYKLTD